MPKFWMEIEIPEVPDGYGPPQQCDGKKISGPLIWCNPIQRIREWNVIDATNSIELNDSIYCLPKPWSLDDAINKHIKATGKSPSVTNPLYVVCRDNTTVFIFEARKRLDKYEPIGLHESGKTFRWRSGGEWLGCGEHPMDIVGPYLG